MRLGAKHKSSTGGRKLGEHFFRSRISSSWHSSATLGYVDKISQFMPN